ncbi:MAG: TlpA family protein disulfide reductase [Armatimonadetes bacterium]|nr:TlpA family protein disulfide reductase [Armatimonadota bacterium]
MKKKLKFILSIIIVVFCFLYKTGYSAETPQANNKAVNFSLNGLDDNKVILNNFIEKKKVVLLTFWTTWCASCKEEMPKIIELQNNFKNSGLEILGINYEESKLKVKKFAAKYKINYKILLDEEGEVTESYGISGVPYIIIIDKKGEIYYQGNGLPNNYKAILTKLVNNKLSLK